jgi:hypothetical protein
MKNIYLSVGFTFGVVLAGMQAQATILTDFQPSGPAASATAKWQAYSDQVARGNSEASYQIEQEGSNSYLQMRGKLAAGFFYPYAGVQMLWQHSREIKGLARAQGIKFRARGDGKVYRLQLLLSSVTDFNEYSHEFSPGANWQQFEVRFDQLKQAGWGQQVNWDPAKIRGIGFHLDGGVMPFQLALDDLALF